MTKMPDKIFAGFMGGSRFWGEATPKTHPDNTIYVRSDLIPQPVTDEARAKALVEFNRLLKIPYEDKMTGDERTFGSYLDQKSKDTIKSALSQPSIPVQDELEALKAENADLRYAVIDFSNADELSGDGNRSIELSKVCDQYSKTISKAKAVQS